MAMICFGGRVIKQIELNHKPPVCYIQATSPFNAGIQHGRLAKFRINDWFDTPEMRKIFAFTKTEAGSLELENLKRANGKHEGQSAERSFCMPTQPRPRALRGLVRALPPGRGTRGVTPAGT